MSEIREIPEEAISGLKKNPQFATQFNEVWGPGAAESVLGSTRADPSVVNKSTPTDGPERDLTLGGKVFDASVKAVAYGAQESANETVDTFESFNTWFGQKMDQIGLPSYLGVYENEDGETEFGFRYYRDVVEAGDDFAFFGKGDVKDDGFEINLIDRPQTTTGQIVGGISQFVTGYGAVGRLTKLTGVTGAFVKGGVVDFGMFEPTDKNITGLVESYGVDLGEFGDLMATDPEDPEWMNRLRNMTEGVAAGGVVEMIAYGFRAKALAKKGNLEAAADASASATRALKEVEKELAKAAKEVNDDALKTIDVANIFDTIPIAKGADGKAAIRTLDDADTATAAPVRDPDQLELDLGDATPAPKPDLTEGRARWLTRQEVESVRYYARLADGVLPKELAKGLSIVSPNQVKAWEDVLPQMASIREVFNDEFMKTPGSAKERWATTKMKAAKQLRELAALTGEDPNEVIKRFAGGFAKKEDLAAEVIARNAYVKSLLAKTDEMAEAISKGEFDSSKWKGYKDLNQLKMDYNKRMSLASAVVRENQATRASVGRALNAMKIDKSDDAVLKRVMDDPNLMGDIEAMANAHAMAKQNGEPVISALEKAASGFRQTLDIINNYRINALLSGPGTQEVNFVSNLINAFAIPTQQFIGGLTTFDASMMLNAVKTVQGMVATAYDSTDVALKALYNAEGILDPQNAKIEEALADKFAKTAVGQVMNTPSRLLLGMDEFFKQSAYRGRIFADASEIARKRGLKGKDKTDFIQGYIKNSFDETGKATRGEALLQAQRTTFTEQLHKGGLGAKLQTLAAGHPTIRFVVPFVRTPINILSTALQHVPVAGALSRRWREDFAFGGARRAQAIGKMVIGSALVTMAASHVAQGNITGSGPADPRIRKVWLKNNRPYSVRIEQEDGSVRWISYARYEPMGQLLALTADYAEIMNNKYQENASRNIPMAILMATAENSINKTFTQGIHEFMSILNDPSPYKRERALNNMLASFVPNALNQMNGDDAYREARTLMDAVWSRTGNFEKVDPKRNVLGEVVYRPLPKVDPLAVIYKDEVEIDPVMKQITDMAILNQTVAGQPNRTIAAPQEPSGKIDLSEVPYSENQSLYDAWLERTGTIKIGGLNLRERLEKVIESHWYKDAPPGAVGVSNKDTKGGILKGVIQDYRKAAKADIPELVDLLAAAERGEARVLMDQVRKNRGNTDIEMLFTPQQKERRFLEGKAPKGFAKPIFNKINQ